MQNFISNNRVKEIRQRKGFSQLKLSQKTGIAPSDISNLERGKQYVFPGWKKRISDALGVGVLELFPNDSVLEEREKCINS